MNSNYKHIYTSKQGRRAIKPGPIFIAFVFYWSVFLSMIRPFIIGFIKKADNETQEGMRRMCDDRNRVDDDNGDEECLFLSFDSVGRASSLFGGAFRPCMAQCKGLGGFV